MKKILTITLALALALSLALGTVAISPRYADISTIMGTASAVSSTKIVCSALVSAYSEQDIEIEIVVTDASGKEIGSYYSGRYGRSLSLEKYINVAAGGTYTCKFYFTCGSDSPVVTRTVRT